MSTFSVGSVAKETRCEMESRKLDEIEIARFSEINSELIKSSKILEKRPGIWQQGGSGVGKERDSNK